MVEPVLNTSTTQHPWKDKISNAAQLGGIETSVLDNGAGRGTRIAWVNTGTGLRYKIVLDRGMDIADAFYNQHSIAWLSNGGVSAPQPFSNQGADWLKTFGGGLLTTCGLTHVGSPENDLNGTRGLHDQISNLSAEIISVIQPDPVIGKMDMHITGLIRQTQVLGPSLELRRTISATLGQATIRIHDEITNRGNTPAPHMLLYHCNFGWPLVDEGTDILFKGNWQAGPGESSHQIFREGNNFRKCAAPLPAHSGTGEAVAFINAVADIKGLCSCALYNSRLEIAMILRFKKVQLPWLTNWQHWGKGEYVTALEPGTHPPIGQANARETNQLIYLQPAEMRVYDLEIEIMDSNEKINQLLENTF